jgi:hypothetical protein
MYQSVKAIRGLYANKQEIVKSVYVEKDLAKVYTAQSKLNAMGISIYSDAASVVLGKLNEDGCSSVVWPRIASQLDQLNFIGIPTASEVQEAYAEAVKDAVTDEDSHGTVIPDNPTEDTGNMQEGATYKIRIPKGLPWWVAQGVAVPLALRFLFGPELLMVKVLEILNGGFILVKALKGFGLLDAFLPKSSSTQPHKQANARSKPQPLRPIDYQSMYEKAIDQAMADNMAELERWFDRLEAITTKEIDIEKHTEDRS